ncbi:DNA-3-methyladenine glycosylase I [Trichothermofontia sp.]
MSDVSFPRRCGWVNNNPLYIAYHDREWGVPVHDDRRLFEFLILEEAQAGLSWLTVLKKREHCGWVNDHTIDCFRHAQCTALAGACGD